MSARQFTDVQTPGDELSWAELGEGRVTIQIDSRVNRSAPGPGVCLPTL